MSEHRATTRRRRSRSGRIRAVLSLGIALGLGAVGTFAFWTDDVVISGSAFTAGTLDLQVNNVNSYATTTLGMTNMVPGVTSAEVLTIKNNGNASLKYSITGGLTGTDAATYSTAGSLKLTVVSGGTRSGTGSASTCTGGTPIVTAAALTGTASTVIVPKRGPMVGGAIEMLCFQVAFDSAAPTSLQGKTATATFTATGTSDLS